MSLITWETPAGDLGTFSSLAVLSKQLWATSDDPGSEIKYKFLSGSFPTSVITDPITISLVGVLSGTIENVLTPTTSTFTIRAYDQYGAVRDRTFSITVVNSNIPKFTTLPGSLMYITDSIYISYQIEYVNPVSTNVVSISVSGGVLPPGLRMDSSGQITGYAKPPVLLNGAPSTKTYTFSVQLLSQLGNSTSTFSITVTNHQLDHGNNTRIPVILNSKPRISPIPESDEFYDYYLASDNIITPTRANEFFSFKVIGHDFDGGEVSYAFSGLPTGLSGDETTGWITGVVPMTAAGINNYQFSARTYKRAFPEVSSEAVSYSLVVSNGLENDIVWTTNEDLGIIDNGTVSQLYVSAASSKQIIYSVISGQLPPNLVLRETGELVGRVSFQPIGQLLEVGAQSEFSFTIIAYASQFPLLRQTRTFTLKVNQVYADPFETIYVKASPSIGNRAILATLLNDTTLIPDSSLYRPTDPYFGKATDIRFVHAYGMKPASLETYIESVQENHYMRQLVLGSLKTAQARDNEGNVIYEVVYSEIIDDLITPDGVSIPKTIVWSKPIPLPNSTVTSTVYPASLSTMRNEIVSKITQNTNISLLPQWMTSQQPDGNTTGFIQGWVICYTLPGHSATIKNNIETKWGNTMNSIEFIVDRYIVDRSATYDWNIKMQTPSWSELPSATPAPESLEDYNLSVLFPKKSIIPTLGQ